MNVKDKVILAVAAHADDLDFGCAGSIASWVNQGASVYYLILTDGSKGSEDMTISTEELVKMRVQEQRAAAKILGVTNVFFGGFIDGELQNSPEVRYKIVRTIREFKPDIVLTTDPTFIYNSEIGFINHPDHRNAGQATLDSVFPFARNSRTFPDLLDEGLKPHSVKDILLINFSAGDFYIDITETFEQKITALKEHKSQLSDVATFVKRMRERASMIGKKNAFKFAESFIRITLNS